MSKPLDLTGQVYGRLTAVQNTGRKYRTNYIWLFRCECGRDFESPAGDVRSGATRSCGCLRAEMSADRASALSLVGAAATKTHGMSQTATFASWDAMKSRCLNPNNSQFHRYGGRGIKVCARWLGSFEAFVEDMGVQPSGMTLERINNDSNYEPGNCRWASRVEQANNRSTNVMLTFQGKTMSIADWSRKTGIARQTIAYRIRSGWAVNDALTKASLRAQPSVGGGE